MGLESGAVGRGGCGGGGVTVAENSVSIVFVFSLSDVILNAISRWRSRGSRP